MEGWQSLKRLFCAVLIGGLLSPVTARAEDNFGFDAYGKLVEAQGSYWARIGEMRVNFARSEVNYAYAEYIRTQSAYWAERTRYLTLFVDRLKLDFFQLKERERTLRNKLQRLERYARTMVVLKTGRTSPNVFLALKNIKMEAVEVSLFLNAEKVEVPALPPTDFISNKKDGKPVEGFPAGNVAKLIRFIEVKNYSLEPGGDAYFAVLQYLADLEKGAEDKLAEIERHMRELEDGTLDIWRPPSADAVPSYPVNSSGFPGGGFPTSGVPTVVNPNPVPGSE